MSSKEQTQSNSLRQLTRIPIFQYALSTISEIDMTIIKGFEYLSQSNLKEFRLSELASAANKGLYSTANELSTEGVGQFQLGIYTALYHPWIAGPGGELIPSTPIHAYKALKGSLFDFKDGIRSRYPGLISWAISWLNNQQKPDYSEESGHLWDASCDRAREALACNLCAKFYLEKTGDKKGAQLFIDAGYSCGIPSIIRAYAESQGSSVSESKFTINDLKTPREAWEYMKGTSFVRPALIYLMSHELGQGRIDNGIILANTIYQSNIKTAIHRLDTSNWEKLDSTTADYNEVVSQGGQRAYGLINAMEGITSQIQGDNYQEGSWRNWLNQQPGFEHLPL